MSVSRGESGRIAAAPAAASRARLRPDDIRRSMDNCTKCGICQAHCPVATATDASPGPKYAGPQAQRFRVIGGVHESSAALCSGCGVCTSVCPNNVAITDIIALAKADIAERHGGVGLGQRLLNRPDTIGRAAAWAPWLGNLVLDNRLARYVAERLFGIDRAAPLPRFAGRRFRKWLDARAQPEGPVVEYFPGCAVTHYDPQVGIAAIEVLNALGYRVAASSTGCCALPMLSSGEWDPARRRAAALVAELAPAAANGRSIVATSTSCSLTLRSKYAAYLDMSAGKAADVADAVRDICGFLLDRHADELARQFGSLKLRVLYHGPCQLRGHHLGLPASELMARIPGLELVLSRADCCGVAGTYGYDRHKRGIAERVGATLMDQISQCQPDLIVCDSETCRWSIAKSSGLPCVHPVEILAKALGIGRGALPIYERLTLHRADPAGASATLQTVGSTSDD